MVDLVAGRPGQIERIGASIMNNTVPLAALRNDMGKLITPYMREINSGVFQSWRNRNLASENIPGVDSLPIKYDMLNGEPIRDYDFMTRAFNVLSPVSLNLVESEGRNFLFESGYDLRISTFYAPDGTNLTDDPGIRSQFQQAIGQYGLEEKLEELARDPKVIASMELMRADIRAGNRGQFNARDYYHNIVIDRLFKRTRRLAWNSIKYREDILQLIREQKQKKLEQDFKTSQSSLLTMYK